MVESGAAGEVLGDELQRQKVSFVVVVRNEARRLPRVLESIRSQKYNAEHVEVIVVDGHSTDGTEVIAKDFGCRVLVNDLIRAEPGVALGFAEASGDVVIVLAADNVLHDSSFLEHIVQPFADERVAAAMPFVVSTEEDDADISYVNYFSDPFNHFLYWDAVSPRTFRDYYPEKYRTGVYVVYDFEGRDMPLLALAQGMAIRKGVNRDPSTIEDDISPIIAILKAGFDVACVESALIEHHTAASGAELVKKFRPRLKQRLAHRDSPVWQRSTEWSLSQRVRATIWPFYGISFFAPLLMSLYRYLRNRETAWLNHALFNFRFAGMAWQVLLDHYVWRPVKALGNVLKNRS